MLFFRRDRFLAVQRVCVLSYNASRQQCGPKISSWRVGCGFLVCYTPLGRFFCSIFLWLVRAVRGAGAQPAQRLATKITYGAASTEVRARGLSQSRYSSKPDSGRQRMALRLLAVAAAVSALDRPTSRFQNAFGNRGSSVRRKRTLPVYRPPDSPATPLPVPGSSRTLRYQPEGAANAQLVRDLQQYGALVIVIGDGEDEPIGCVVDVRLAEVLNRRPCVFTRLLERRCWVVSFSNSRRVSRRSPTRARPPSSHLVHRQMRESP